MSTTGTGERIFSFLASLQSSKGPSHEQITRRRKRSTTLVLGERL
jgi:hypothetical protein